MAQADHLGPFPQVGKVVALSASVPGIYRHFTNIRGHRDVLYELQGVGRPCSGPPSLIHGEAGPLTGERDLLSRFLLFLSRSGPCHRPGVQLEGWRPFRRIHG